jgi:(p)ppGpp synthase/HD superfamily hydrolase
MMQAGRRHAHKVRADPPSPRPRRPRDRYIMHPLEVAAIVARENATATAVCAALLHDVVEDAGLSPALLHTEFGPDITTMVEDLTLRRVRNQSPVGPEAVLVMIADRLHNLRTIKPLPAARRQRVALDTLVFHVPLAQRLNLPAVAAEMTDISCAALASLDGPDARERCRHLATSLRRVRPRWAVDGIAAVGGGMALVGSDSVPAWLLAGGGAGVLAVVAAALFGPDPRAAERLSDLLEAWRRG